MKNLLLLFLIIGISMPVAAQKRNEAYFFKKVSLQRSIDPTVKQASLGISRNYTIRDSLLFFTRSFETAILKGRRAGAVKPTLIKEAQKRYPGTSYSAVTRRLQFYATEGKKVLR